MPCRSPYDGNIHPGPLSADAGSWDGYRTTYPWLAITNPQVSSPDGQCVWLRAGMHVGAFTSSNVIHLTVCSCGLSARPVITLRLVFYTRAGVRLDGGRLPERV